MRQLNPETHPVMRHPTGGLHSGERQSLAMAQLLNVVEKWHFSPITTSTCFLAQGPGLAAHSMKSGLMGQALQKARDGGGMARPR